MNIAHLVHVYGYGAVFVLVAVESLGVPLPGETALIAAATYAGTTHGLSIGLVFAVAAAAAILGDTAGYWIGDAGGYRLLYRYGHYVRLDESKIKVAHYLFERRGGVVVFFGRFVSVLRTYAAFLAGTTRMRYRRFLFFNASGGIAWAALYAFLAYYAGTFLSKTSTSFEVGFASAAVVVIVVGLLVLRRQMSVLVERAEAAYPGPLVPPGAHHARGQPDAGGASTTIGVRDEDPGSQEPPRPAAPGPAAADGGHSGMAAEGDPAGEQGESSSR
ncbi:MAG: DedA family protein [Acidimicrobiales bacterium]